MYIKSLLASAFAVCAFAAPVPADDCEDVGTAGTFTAEQLIKIAPATASCSGGDFPEECADATSVAAAINKSFETYKITSKGEQAAIIAYMIFESGNFKYNKNHFPGRPGQGTRMMAMPPFVEKYATAIAGADAVAKAKAGPDGLNDVLKLVNSNEELAAGSAAWFLTSTCSPEVRQGLESESIEGWHNFLTECVGTTAAAERDGPWTATKQAMAG